MHLVKNLILAAHAANQRDERLAAGIDNVQYLPRGH